MPMLPDWQRSTYIFWAVFLVGLLVVLVLLFGAENVRADLRDLFSLWFGSAKP